MGRLPVAMGGGVVGGEAGLAGPAGHVVVIEHVDVLAPGLDIATHLVVGAKAAEVIHGGFATPHGTGQLIGGLVDVQHGAEGPIKKCCQTVTGSRWRSCCR